VGLPTMEELADFLEDKHTQETHKVGSPRRNEPSDSAFSCSP